MSSNCVEIVCLPLYTQSMTQEKVVQSNNGINLWKAGGRLRHENEIEILIPELFLQVLPDFFPEEGMPFELRLPNYVTLSAKCTKGMRSVQSSPSKDLGKWLLRQVLRISSGTIINYEMLEKKGIDALYFEKWQEGANTYYKVFPAPIGEYELFVSSGITKRKEVRTVGSMRSAALNGFKVVEKTAVDDFDISEGDVINHKAFGQGHVKSIENDMIELDFNGTTKSFKFSWLVNNKIITVS